MKAARCILTRQAMRALADIYTRSSLLWGEPAADRYVKDIYSCFDRMAANPKQGCLRMPRSTPFMMVPAGRHFVVYDLFGTSVVVLAILHQRQDIEKTLAKMEPLFLAEIRKIKKQEKHRVFSAKSKSR